MCLQVTCALRTMDVIPQPPTNVQASQTLALKPLCQPQLKIHLIVLALAPEGGKEPCHVVFKVQQQMVTCTISLRP